MIKKITLIYLFFGFFACVGFNAYSQINFSVPQILFTQACASPGFNSFNFSFSFFPPTALQPGNQFIVELSDSSGSFASPTTVKVLTNTTSPVSSNFSLPTTAYGEGYRIRVRSTAPVKISNPSNAFAAYYAVHNQPFSINGNIGTVNICENDTYTLQIDNTGTSASPVFYPTLNYTWFRNFVEIAGETGPSLQVSDPGSYYVVVDYGTCVMNSYSNMVQVNVMSTLSPSITSQAGSVIICPGGSNTLTSSITSGTYTYQWFKDNIAIPTATATTYAATESGVYHLAVANGPCVFESDAIALDLLDINLTLNPSATTTLIPGETVALSALTDANAPVYKWYKDGVLIAGATLSTYNATQAGTYKVEVTQTTPCYINKDAEIVIANPTGFDLAIQPSAAYAPCASNSVTLVINQFDANTPGGDVNLIGNAYGYSYQWYKNEVAVPSATGNTISLTNPVQNGNYKLKINIPGYGEITSNAFDVNLNMGVVSITGDSTFCTSSSVLLSATPNNLEFTYQWYKDNIAIAGQTAATLSASAEGEYYVIAHSGICNATSNVSVVSEAAIVVTSAAPAIDVIIPGQVKVITVATDAVAPAYAWYKDGAPMGGTTPTLTASQEGEYMVEVMQTAGCNATAQKTFILEYPSAFNLNIATAAGYTSCISTSATLQATSFTAVTTQGNIDVMAMGYAYQWYKNNAPVAGATSATINFADAAQNGEYKLGVTIPYFGIIYSNNININIAVGTVSITNDTVLCEGANVLFSSSINSLAYSYQWYKDNVAITGATAPSYSANAEGNYHLSVTGGICSAQSNTINLTIADISVSSTSPATAVILPGETKIITIVTDAAAPSYSWTRNGAAISNTTSTLNATQDGEYIATVTQTSGCAATAQIAFTLNYPSAFNLSIATTAGYTACASAAATLQASSFTATTPDGPVDVTGMGYAVQWYKNNVAVAGETSSVLTLTNASQNGTYKLGATVPSFGVIYSNDITINLPVEAVTISNDTVLCAGSTVTLTPTVTAMQYTYQWYKDNIAIAGANAPAFIANAEGAYHVIVTAGTCNAQSNTINLAIAPITVSSTFPAMDVILPGQTKTISVTTDAVAPTYTWTRNGAPVSNTTATLSATEDGIYVVTVTQTSGCNATAQQTFELEYPSAFNLAIEMAAGYTACTSASATLQATTFTATTPNGTIDVSAQGYALQWYKDNVPVAGATSSTLTLTGAEQNGVYKLGASVPGFVTIFSGDIVVNLALEAITISNNTGLCPGGNVIISADTTSPEYSYQWFKDNAAIAGATSPTVTVTDEGSYNLTVTGGACSAQSNTINLAIASIIVNSSSPSVDVILPGQTRTITVTTDAQTPVYSWTRNGADISNTSPVLVAAEDGEYIVTVTQTAGCSATAEKTFVLHYPTGFTLTVAANPSYTACTSATASLNISTFVAATINGDIDVSSITYSYQWYKDGVAITGATSATLNVTDAAQNGEYTLGVTIPGFAEVLSNSLTVNVNIGTVEITSSGTICESNPTVAITSNMTNPDYTYTWYKDGVATAETGTGMNASEAGEYYLAVNTGTCNYTSDPITVSTGDFNLTTGNITTEYLIPGESIQLSVSTNALQPEFEWYRNGTLITGETSTILEVTLDGEYKLVATQTQGCVMSKELTFTVEYATDFEILVDAGSFIPCNSSTALLSVVDFSAVTPMGPVDVTGDTYAYQWLLNNQPVPGANTMIFEAVTSGTYTLQVDIPEIGTIISNEVSITLAFVADVHISADGVLCPEGGNVTLTSDANSTDYAYKWFNQANEVIGTQNVVIVTQPGTYYLAVTYQNCIITSNMLDVEVADMDMVTLDRDPYFSILEGTTTTVTAGGADTYQWFLNGDLISTEATATISEAGTYSVIAKIGDCEITKSITVTTRVNNLIAIPNVITPNGDGINDKWVLPVQYASETTEVVIYGPDGKIVLKAYNYDNNWPENDFNYPLNNPVYYYTIMENNEITKRGSITLIR